MDDVSHSINVPQLPNISLLLMDSADSKSNEECDVPSPTPSPSTSPDLQHFFLDSKISEAIVASEADITKSLSDFRRAATTAVAATRVSTTIATDAYMREVEACQAQVLEAHSEFRNAIVVSLACVEEHTDTAAADFHDAVMAATFGLHVRLAAVMALLEQQQAALGAAHGRAAVQFCKAAEAARVCLHAHNGEVADTFTRSIYALLHDNSTPSAFETIFQQQTPGAAANTTGEAAPGVSYELEKYKVVMQMMNLASSIRSKIQDLTSRN